MKFYEHLKASEPQLQLDGEVSLSQLVMRLSSMKLAFRTDIALHLKRSAVLVGGMLFQVLVRQ